MSYSYTSFALCLWNASRQVWSKVWSKYLHVFKMKARMCYLLLYINTSYSGYLLFTPIDIYVSTLLQVHVQPILHCLGWSVFTSIKLLWHSPSTCKHSHFTAMPFVLAPFLISWMTLTLATFSLYCKGVSTVAT